MGWRIKVIEGSVKISEYCYKAGIYWKLEVKREMCAKELVNIFNKFDCRVLYYDEDDNYVVWDDEINKYHPRYINDGLILEYICKYRYGDCEEEFAITQKEIGKYDEQVKILEWDSIDISDPVIFSYVWYDGVDEPFVEVKSEIK